MDISQLRPDSPVQMTDRAGNIVTMPAAQAQSELNDPRSNYALTTPEEADAYNKRQLYGTPGQQAITAAEGLVNTAALGFGNALTKTAIDLFSPKDSKLAKQYAESVKQRQQENPVAQLGGEVAGIAVDPLGAGEAVSNAASKVGSKVAQGAAELSSKVAPTVEGIVTSPTAQNIIKRGAQFATEGGTYGGTFETGRQLVDDEPLNADAIIGHIKGGAILGGAGGAVVGGLENAGTKAFTALKERTKTLLDKFTGATPEQSGEIFSELPVTALQKERSGELGLGRNDHPIKFEDQGNGIFKYTDGKREGTVAVADSAKGIDISNPQDVQTIGQNLGISDLDTKIKFKKPDQTFEDFLSQEMKNQDISDLVRANYPYMSEQEQRIADQIQKVRDNFKAIDAPTKLDEQLLDAANKQEKKLYLSIDQEPQVQRMMKGFDTSGRPIFEEPAAINPDEKNAFHEAYDKEIRDQVHREMSQYDFIKDGKDAYVYNEGILPESVPVQQTLKGRTPLDFDSKMIAKQFRMTPTQIAKTGNQRLNEVSQFILDQYPKEGSILKRATTSADYIAENIANARNKAINDMNDAVESALNIGGNKQSLTTKDIADYVEKEILPNYTDPKSGNPAAGLSKQYNQIKDFADQFRENGFVEDKYGRRVYQPIDVRDLRQIRMRMDNVAKFEKAPGQISALENAARDLRGWMEDNIVSRVKSVDPELVEKYNLAKKNYGLSIDAGKIVDKAAAKAAKDTNFSLFYSGLGSAIGAGVGGAPGAVIGGLVGGAAKQTLNEFSGALSIFMANNLGKNIERYENLIDGAAKAFFKPQGVAAETYLKLPKDSDKEVAATDYKRLVSELMDRDKFVESFANNNEDLINAFPQTSQSVMASILKARDFLLSKIPQNPYQGNPFKEKDWSPSPVEMNKYMRYREAVNDPKVIISQIKNGYATPEAIEVLNQVYPETKQALMTKFLEQANGKKNIPIEKRVELYKIFGVQLDQMTTGKGFIRLQMNANGQVQSTLNQNSSYKPGTVFKTSIGKKDTTLGNQTVE